MFMRPFVSILIILQITLEDEERRILQETNSSSEGKPLKIL